jgi:hypothetical protein
MKEESEKALQIADYGLKVLPDTDLKITNDYRFERLLQLELKAIKDGLKFVKDQGGVGKGKLYSGYANEFGTRQGLGVMRDVWYKYS